MRFMPDARWTISRPALAPLAGLALLLAPSASWAVLLADASSIVSLACVSVIEPIDPIAAPVDYSCDRLWFAPGNQSGPSRASASTGFGDPLTVSVHAECADAPFQISTNAASRIKSQLAVAQIATPPAHVDFVPVSMSTAGNVTVSPLAGLLAAGGTYVSSTESLIFTNADVFAHTMRTNSPSFVLSDDYDIVQTLDLRPDHVYFVNVSAGCNFSLAGTWACDGHATATFHLDQAAFDARMGGNSFDLSQFFVVQRSPNLAPEPGPALLGLAAVGAVRLCATRSRLRAAGSRAVRHARS
jgi:hypothetical protein